MRVGSVQGTEAAREELGLPKDGASELTEFDAVRRWVLRVVFEACPLEVLYALTRGVELLREREAELRQPPVRLPVIAETPTEVVARLGEVGLPRDRRCGRDSGLIPRRVIIEPLTQDVPTEIAEQDIVRRCVLRVVFHPHALEILHGVFPAVLQQLAPLVTEGVAVAGEATMPLPVVEEPAPCADARLGEALLHRASVRPLHRQPTEGQAHEGEGRSSATKMHGG